MLDPLSRFVARRYKVVVCVWIIALILLMPFYKKVDEALTYSEEPFLPAYVESKRAFEIVNEEFPGLNLSDVILVIRGGDVREEKLRTFLTTFEEEAKGVDVVKSVDSLVDAYRLVLNRYWEIMNKSREEAINKLLPVAEEVHAKLLSLNSSLRMLASAIYGPPSVYYRVWRQVLEEYNGTSLLDIDRLNELAFYTSKESLLRFYEEGLRELSPLESFLASRCLNGYYYYFYLNWRALLKGRSTNKTELLRDDSALMEEAVRRSLAPLRLIVRLYSKAPSFGESPYLKLFDVIMNDLNVTNWNSTSSVERALRDYLKLTLSEEEYKFAEKLLSLPSKPSREEYREAVESIVEEKFKEYKPPPYPKGIPKPLYRKYVDSSNLTMLVYIDYVRDYNERQGTEAVKRLRAVVKELKSKMELEGFDFYFTGSYAFSADMEDLVSKDISNIDKAAIMLILLILGGALLSPVAPLLPLLSAGIALLCCTALIYFIASYALPLHYFARNFLTPVVLGAGVDYSIFLFYRFLEERSRGLDELEALRNSIKYGGKALVSSGLTVMVGFGGMALSDFGVLRSVGMCLALGVFMALATSMTFTPSLIAALGRWVFWPRRPSRAFRGRGLRSKYLRKAAEVAVRRPRWILIMALVATVALGSLTATMRRSFNPIEMLPMTEAKKGYDVIAESFGNYLLSNVLIVVETPYPLTSGGNFSLRGFKDLRSVYGKVEALGPKVLIGPLSPVGKSLTYEELNNPKNLNKSLKFIGRNHKTALMIASFNVPWLSEASFKAVNDLRELLRPLRSKGLKIYVGGDIALTGDIRELVNREFFTFMAPLIITGIYFVLLLLLRSVFTPIRLIITIVMSIIWALGALVLVAQVMEGVPIYWVTPIVVFNGLIGLGMDYDIFLISRMKEEVDKGLGDEEAIIKAVEVTGTVITLCGSVMAASLATLMLSRVLILREVGFAFSLAIFLDAFLVRVLLVPSIMVLMKKWNWWAPWPLRK